MCSSAISIFRILRQPGGTEFVTLRLFSEVAKDAAVGHHFVAMPSVDRFLRSANQSFMLEDIASGSYQDRINTREMWLEIGKTLLRIKRLLSQARAYHDEEALHLASGHPEARNLAAILHLDKMANFDLAAILLGKVSDLTARLVFERLGASLIPNLDRSDPDWEYQIRWNKIKVGLLDRTGNPNVASLTDSEHATLLAIFDDFFATDHGTSLWLISGTACPAE